MGLGVKFFWVFIVFYCISILAFEGGGFRVEILEIIGLLCGGRADIWVFYYLVVLSFFFCYRMWWVMFFE